MEDAHDAGPADVRVLLDVEGMFDLDGSHLGHPAHITAPQIHQHLVLAPFFLILQEFLLWAEQDFKDVLAVFQNAASKAQTDIAVLTEMFCGDEFGRFVCSGSFHR